MRHRGRRGCRITAALMAAVMTAGAIAGCSKTQENETGQSDEQDTQSIQETAEFVPEIAGVYEAEEGSFTGNVKADTAKPGYSGAGYADSYRNVHSTITKERRNRYAENQHGCTDKKQPERNAAGGKKRNTGSGSICGYRGYLLCNCGTDTWNTGELLHVGWGCLQSYGLHDSYITDISEV